jgi:hypothetical protein
MAGATPVERPTKGRRRNRLRRVIVLVVLLLAIRFAATRVCADGGAMASAYRTCDCRGWEWLLSDSTAADGPRRTICLGYIASTTCYQFRDGPVVTCPR